MSDLSHTTNAAVVAYLAAQAVIPKTIEQNGVPILVLPGNLKHHSLEQLLDNPHRTKAAVQMYNTVDLCAYIKQQVKEDSSQNPVLFADRKTHTLVAFLDYHKRDVAAWLDHKVTVKLEQSSQLQKWLAKNNQFMPQDRFAEFLDENLNDIQTPTPTEVLNFVEVLECTRKETFRSAIRQTTGEIEFKWSKENQNQDSAKIIEKFTLGIPLFLRGEPIAIHAKLFHRISEAEGQKAQLTFKYRLDNLDRIMDSLWDEMLTAVKTSLAEICTVYEGLPPAVPTPVSI